jgi:hypothetical protein
VLLESICFYSNPFPPLLCCRGGISNETDLFFCSEVYPSVLIVFFTTPKSRVERRVTAAVILINLADAEFWLGVSNAQLSDARRELANTKTLLTDTQITLLASLNDLSAQQSQISSESLRNDQDNILLALNSARDLLNPTFPAFSLDSKDLLSSVESFA